MITETIEPKKRGRPKKIKSTNGDSLSPSAVIAKLSKEKTSKTKPGSPAAKAYVVIDHPTNGSTIQPQHYAIKIGASGGEAVEFSMDGGEWQQSRFAEGFYWYDWHSIPSGSHKIVARIKLPTGKYKKSKITRCQVA